MADIKQIDLYGKILKIKDEYARDQILQIMSNIVGVENSLKNDYADKNYLAEQLSKLVDGSPEVLDTFNEFAKALGNDPNFATTMANNLNNKVDKVFGMGLSQNNLTNALLVRIMNSASLEDLDSVRSFVYGIEERITPLQVYLDEEGNIVVDGNYYATTDLIARQGIVDNQKDIQELEKRVGSVEVEVGNASKLLSLI